MKRFQKDLPHQRPEENFLEGIPGAAAAATSADEKGEKHDDCSALLDARQELAKLMRQKRIWINLSNCKQSSVRRAAALLGLKEVSDKEEWTLLWTNCPVSMEKAKELKSYQKVNRFPAMNEICRKDFLARNLNRMLKRYPGDYNIFPKTWCLPSEYPDLVDYCRGTKCKLFICKPTANCQGRGIFLTRNIRDVRDREDMVCQVYIPKTIQVLEMVSSPSQDAGIMEKNVGHSSELSPDRADVEPEQNANGSEHCPLIPNQTPAEQEKPDQRQQQTEVPLEIAADVQDGTAGSEVGNQPDTNIQELEAHSGAQAVEEESQSLQTSSKTSSQTLSGSIEEVNQEDLQFQPESCHQSQAKAGVQTQAEVQDQSLREANDQGQLPAQELIEKEFQEQLLQELHDQPEMEEGACDQADEEVCECGQAEAQYQAREEDTQLEIFDLVQNSMIVEETQLEDALRAESTEPSGTWREFHPEVQSQLRCQGSPEAPAFQQEEEMSTRETPSTAASQVIKKLSKALKTKGNKVGPADDKTYPGRTEHGNITEVFSNEPRDQLDSCCSCWDYNRICCVEPDCRNPSEHQQNQGTERFPSVSAHPERVAKDKSRGNQCMSSKPPTPLHRGLIQSSKPRTGQKDFNSNGRNTAKCCRPCCLL